MVDESNGSDPRGHVNVDIQRSEESLFDWMQQKYMGCLVGGAVGDALGAPVEFWSAQQIRARFGAAGIQEYVPAFGKLGAITDDTQMTLFTAEGLLRSRFSKRQPTVEELRSYIAKGYQRWFYTQGSRHPLQADSCNGWLLEQRDLFSMRAPGNTCMSGLSGMRNEIDLASNDSKGCGGVMRVAPIGMYFSSLSRRHSNHHKKFLADAFELGCQSAAITHGHPTGQLSSGVFAAVIMGLLCGKTLVDAIEDAKVLLGERESCGETIQAIDAACKLARVCPNDPDALYSLGAGWVAEEALSIALYCALSVESFRSGVELAVNHSGDSDSTGSMAGQLLGAIHGYETIPSSWTGPLKMANVISSIADDLTLRDWSSEEITAAAIGNERDMNVLTETGALRAYAVMVNSMSIDAITPILADDFVHESQRNFDVYKTKPEFLEFVSGVHQSIRKSGERAFAEMGRVWCPASTMTSSSIEAAESDAAYQAISRNGNIRPCVILAHGDIDTPDVVVLAKVVGNKLSRIDLCVIPGPESAERSGEYPQ